MIIKVTRGNDFTGAIDYIARLGIYARKDSARVIALERLYDLRTAASQLGYDAARDPSRSRPVVHLIARAERGLSDGQYLDLARRMLRAAGMEGRRFVATAHDDDGHLHVVASEVDEDGAVPPRIFWHKEEKRVVGADEAKTLPRGAVAGRAWDSHLAWRLTRVAREVEVAWNLRRLSSSSKVNAPVEPRREQWQKERLTRSGKVPLQDRYWDEVRAALALPNWDERVDALAVHALVIRAHEVGGRVRGLQVQSLTDAKDFVKISEFAMGGMPKLDASAGQPFLTWAAQERRTAISLAKPATSQNPDMVAMQAAFTAHQKDWHRRNGARIGAYRQRRRDTAAIEADMADFANRFRPILTVGAFRQARAEKRRGLKALADARLAEALVTAGPQRPRPLFIDFVKARAGWGDGAAARVYRDMVGDVSETRRRLLDRVTAMARELAAAARTVRERGDRLRVDLAAATIGLRRSSKELAHQASMEAVRLKAVTRRSVADLRGGMADLAERLARRLDETKHRIRVENGIVRVERWQPTPIEREIIQSPAHGRVFESYASIQTGEVDALCGSIRRTGSVRRIGPAVIFDEARSDIGNPRVLRWVNEPEAVAALYEIDGRQRRDQARAERYDTVHRQRDAAAALDRLRAESVARVVASSAWLITEIEMDLRKSASILRARQAKLAQQERAQQERAAALIVTPAPSMDRGALLAAMAPRGNEGSAEHTYRALWRAEIDAMPPNRAIHRAAIERIEIGVVRDMIHRGFADRAVRRMVCEYSPLRATDTPGSADARADQVLVHVLADPRTRRIRDENAAELAELKDRQEIRARLDRQQPHFPFEERWIALWQDILHERPPDTTVAPAERNRAIDHEVAAAMMREGATLMETRSAIMQFSPTAWALKSDERLAYVDKQVDALDDVLRRMTPIQREKAGPKPVPAVQLAKMWARLRDAHDESSDDDFDWASGELRLLPPNIAVTPGGRANINGFDVIFADIGGAGKGRGKPASSDGGMPLFDAAGQPLPHVLEILDGIRQHRGAFRLVEGRLTAPGQEPEHQKLLNEFLVDPRFEQLALAAYRNPAGAAQTAILRGSER